MSQNFSRYWENKLAKQWVIKIGRKSVENGGDLLGDGGQISGKSNPTWLPVFKIPGCAIIPLKSSAVALHFCSPDEGERAKLAVGSNKTWQKIVFLPTVDTRKSPPMRGTLNPAQRGRRTSKICIQESQQKKWVFSLIVLIVGAPEKIQLFCLKTRYQTFAINFHWLFCIFQLTDFMGFVPATCKPRYLQRTGCCWWASGSRSRRRQSSPPHKGCLHSILCF